MTARIGPAQPAGTAHGGTPHRAIRRAFRAETGRLSACGEALATKWCARLSSHNWLEEVSCEDDRRRADGVAGSQRETDEQRVKLVSRRPSLVFGSMSRP